MYPSDSHFCLICLKKLSFHTSCSTSSGSEPFRAQTSTGDFKTFLTLVSRYLNINLTAVNHAVTLKRGAATADDQNHVCEWCLPMLASFCQLYDKLICLKLEIDQCLIEISKRIRDADKEMDKENMVPAGGSAMRQDNNLKTAATSGVANLFKNFRDTFLKKIHEKRGQDFPQLKLTRACQTCNDEVEFETSHFPKDTNEESIVSVAETAATLSTSLIITKIEIEDNDYLNDFAEDEFILDSSIYHNMKSEGISEDCSGNGVETDFDSGDLDTNLPDQLSSSNNGHPKVKIQVMLASDEEKLEAESQENSAGLPTQASQRGSRKIYSCVMCSKILSCGKGLKDHLLRHTGERPYFCNACDKCYKDRRSLQYHLISAHGSPKRKTPKPTECKVCEECGMQFGSGSKLNVHLLRSHGKPVQFAECKKYIASQYSLNEHIRKFHAPQQQWSNLRGSGNCGAFQCSECSRRFGDKWKLGRHMQTHNKPFKCSFCEKCFARQEALCFHHKKIHLFLSSYGNAESLLDQASNMVRANEEVTISSSSSIPKPCDNNDELSISDNITCLPETTIPTDAGVSPSPHITNSRKSSKPQRDACLFCSKIINSSFMEIHLRTHIKEKPYFCSMCQQCFARLRDLQWHEMKHKNIKPFLCSVCSRGFIRKDKLKCHMLTHSNVKPFFCRCGARFYTRARLRSHLKQFHKMESPPPLCAFCGKQFEDALQCELHEKSCNSNSIVQEQEQPEPDQQLKPEKQKASFQCSECSKQFEQKSKLTRHLQTHFKTHKCEVCGKRFSRRDRLIEHDIKFHNGSASSWTRRTP